MRTQKRGPIESIGFQDLRVIPRNRNKEPLVPMFTSRIKWYSPFTPPNNGEKIIAIVRTPAGVINLESVIYCDDTKSGIIWVVYDSANTGDEYTTSEVVAWASGNEISKSACRAVPQKKAEGDAAEFYADIAFAQILTITDRAISRVAEAVSRPLLEKLTREITERFEDSWAKAEDNSSQR